MQSHGILNDMTLNTTGMYMYIYINTFQNKNLKVTARNTRCNFDVFMLIFCVAGS